MPRKSVLVPAGPRLDPSRPRQITRTMTHPTHRFIHQAVEALFKARAKEEEEAKKEEESEEEAGSKSQRGKVCCEVGGKQMVVGR